MKNYDLSHLVCFTRHYKIKKDFPHISKKYIIFKIETRQKNICTILELKQLIMILNFYREKRLLVKYRYKGGPVNNRHRRLFSNELHISLKASTWPKNLIFLLT